MASLTGQSINTTYNGLLKSSDNGPLGPLTPKVITDGDGNETPLQLAQATAILEKADPVAGTHRLEVNENGVIVTSNNALLQDPGAQFFVGVTATQAYVGDAINGISFDYTQGNYIGTHDFSAATVIGIGGGGGITAVSHVPATPIAIPAITADVIVYSLLIPANTFTTGDIMVVKGLAGVTAGSVYASMWIHTSPALYSGFPIAVFFGSNPSVAFEKTMYVGSTTSTRWWDENFPNEGYAAGSGGGQFSLVDASVDWTVDQYIMLQGYADPGNTGFWHGVTISKIN